MHSSKSMALAFAISLAISLGLVPAAFAAAGVPSDGTIR